MKLIHQETSRIEGWLIAQFIALRRKLWAFDTELAWFASGEGSKLWKELGLEGLANVCFNVSELAKEMPGGGLIAAEAMALAWMLAHEA